MLDAIVRLDAPETVALASQPATFAGGGVTAAGTATVAITRSSLAIRFRPDAPLNVPKAAYGESNGSVATTGAGWRATHVNHAGTAASGETLFGTMALRAGALPAADTVAATRLVIAGDAWQGSGRVQNRNVVVAPLSVDVVSHHDRRLAITVDGLLDEATIETMGRACSFVAGIDVEILRVEHYDAAGALLDVEHRRGYRRVGRGAHCPFTGISDADRTRAWIALVDAFPRLLAAGVPIDMIVDQISAHNQVAQIHVSAVLLLLATVTAAYQRSHGSDVPAPALSRSPELQRLNDDLHLGLSAEEIERWDHVRVELLDGGFFHAPGYESGRPQKDIKFLRDLAHTTVLRLCGYTGPFYGAERFVERELAAAPA
jgi:hypothetical protein